MRHARVFVLLGACALFSAGCGIIKTPLDSHFAFKPPDHVGEQLDRLVSARSIQEIDARFDEILDGEDGQRVVERLLSGWGKHDSWYDLAVVHFHWPSYYGRHKDIHSGPFMRAIVSRIREQPSLLAEYFWYAQWHANGLSFKWLCQACEGPGPCCSIGGEEFPLILLVAGAIRDAQLVHFDPPTSTVRAWGEASLYFLSMRPFLRFDAEQVAYMMDYAAQREGSYLTPDKQEATPPSTPLPNWDSDILPSRPAKK
jgi:hypothetical protein